MIENYKKRFLDMPGRTDTRKFNLHAVITNQPVEVNSCPLPINMQEIVQKEVTEMMGMGVI